MNRVEDIIEATIVATKVKGMTAQDVLVRQPYSHVEAWREVEVENTKLHDLIEELRAEVEYLKEELDEALTDAVNTTQDHARISDELTDALGVIEDLRHKLGG